MVEKDGRKGYITERNGRAPDKGKESHSAQANGMNEMGRLRMVPFHELPFCLRFKMMDPGFICHNNPG